MTEEPIIDKSAIGEPSMRHNVPLSYRRQAVFHVRRPRVGVSKRSPQPRFRTPTGRISYTGLPVYSLSVATGFRCISSGTSLSACIDILPFIGICKALKLHFYFPKARNEISELYIGSTAANAAVTSRRVRGSMKSTLRVYEIPACAGMKCSRVAPARNTRAKLGYVAGLEEPRNHGFGEVLA